MCRGVIATPSRSRVTASASQKSGSGGLQTLRRHVCSGRRCHRLVAGGWAGHHPVAAASVAGVAAICALRPRILLLCVNTDDDMDPRPEAGAAPGPTVDLHAATYTVRLADARICRDACLCDLVGSDQGCAVHVPGLSGSDRIVINFTGVLLTCDL